MKIVLAAINAKYIHSNLAVYSLKAYAKRYANQIVLEEYTINQTIEYILKYLYISKPDVLCFSCYIWNYEYVKRLVKEFHKLCPNVPIWLGGPEVSYEEELVFAELPQITGIMIGEGEATFLELCEHYDKNRPESELSNIAGIAYRKNDTITKTKPRELLDLSSVPFCYDNIQDFENRIIYYESSRGCPFSCSYCLSSVDKKLRFRSLDLVKQELAFFVEHQVPQVKFVDRTFNCKKEHALAIWKYIQQIDQGVTNFHFEVSADLLDEEQLALIKTFRPGLIQLEIGVQSTNDATIKEIKRTMNLDELKQTVHILKSAHNIHQHLDLIVGLPYEDYETFTQSFHEVYALKPDQLQIGFLKVLKGAYMYEHRHEYGIVYMSEPPYEVYETKWLTFEEVLRLKLVEEMVEVYYNSGQFEITMKLLELYYEKPFEFYEKLGLYYERKGLLDRKHTRIARCEILLAFLEKEKQLSKEELSRFKEALTYDLYYRENCKTRPDWAHDLTPFKKVKNKVCKKGRLSHMEVFHYCFPVGEHDTMTTVPEYQNEPYFVLFDYEKRNPLNHQAFVRMIDPSEWAEEQE